MSLTYNTFVAALANFLVMPPSDTNFVAALPNIIDDAEQRMYRDLDLLDTTQIDGTAACTPSVGALAIPIPAGGNGPFLVIQEVNVTTPVGASPGTTNPLTPMSKEALIALYPSVVGAGVPRFFAMVTQALILLGPWPDAAYAVNIVGTVRPKPISGSNQTTLLSLYFPDLFLSAGLAIGAGYLKDFGAASDDPQSGVSWEKKYQTQLKSAIAEEGRKKFQDQGWASLSTGPSATPPRT